MQYIGIIGALLIGVSPFLNWISFSLKSGMDDASVKYSLYHLAKLDKVNGTHYMILVVLLIVLAITIAAVELVDIVPALDFKFGRNEKIKYAQLVAMGLVVLVLVLYFINKDINNSLKWYKELLENNRAIFDDVKGHANRGLGPWICIVGLVLNMQNVISVVEKYKSKP